ncbi:MAG TPA: class I SAM-dependent methyltransferase [Stellaceae bacterium]|nr:class I SAM-dependent methyltransferase [Stellaceae bacterium]
MTGLAFRRARGLKTPSAAQFAFGENWKSFLATVGDASIAEAENGLRRLFPGDEIRGSRFLDLGSGSGLSALAACRLGAAHVEAIDADPKSVAATSALLAKFAPGGNWSARCEDILHSLEGRSQTHDIVYSWGVLHHTGAMWRALDRAASLVAPGGHLAIALYRRTPFCAIWRLEKRCYAKSGPACRKAMRALYKAIFCAGLIATGRSPARYIAAYKSARGMDWHHDVQDWLGGYPYESTDPTSVITYLRELGFAPLLMFERPATAFGLFGSHCDEYVLRRTG